ncbi:hypothetical protein, partial [Klebsiella pneumoniae]|uniref:hypothetical protein n=1 Tax=Klebsiella pneumoniae TaxID=573 RepID=UPI0027300AC1
MSPREHASAETYAVRRQDLAVLEDRGGDELPKTPTPREIVKLLSLDEVEWRISRRHARLLFDGQSLQW